MRAPAKRLRFCVEALLAAIAAALALWILGTTIALFRAGYVALPFWDAWDLWYTYLHEHYSLHWFFAQHNEHRIVVPDLFYVADHLLFQARNWFLVVCIFCLQCVLAVLLWRLVVRVCRQDARERTILGAVIVSCLFSAQQHANFTWGFVVQWPLLYGAIIGAFLALLKSEERRRLDGRGALWVGVSIALAAVANYSLASGVLLWPFLLAAAFWLCIPRSRIGALAAGAVLIGAPFFYGWQGNGPPSHALESTAHILRATVFALDHLGAPVDPLVSVSGDDSLRVTCAAVAGGTLLLMTVAGFTLVWRRRQERNGAQAMLLHVCGLFAVDAGLIAFGRSDFSPTYAFQSRYFTGAYLFWVCLLAAAWPWLRRTYRPLLYAAICGALALGIGIHQHARLYEVRAGTENFRMNETAVAEGVFDPAAWAVIYHTPANALPIVEYFRQHHLSIFTEDWTHWAGLPLRQRFAIDISRACTGGWNELARIVSPLGSGWRASGWVLLAEADEPPRFIVFGDDAGRIAGVALTGRPVPGRFVPWRGYVTGAPATVTAYVLEGDERSLCAIGAKTLSGDNRPAPSSAQIDQYEVQIHLSDAVAPLAAIGAGFQAGRQAAWRQHPGL